MNDPKYKQLREQILKTGKVTKASVTISQKMYSNGTVSPLETKNQDIVEIGIDDLMQAFDTFHNSEMKEAAEWLLEQPSDVEGYTRNSNIRALIPHKWDLSATEGGHSTQRSES